MGTIIKYNSAKTDTSRVYTTSSSGGYATNTNPTTSSTNVTLWGNEFDGKTDLTSSMRVNGDIYLTFDADDFDDSDYTDDDGNNAEGLPTGSLYAQKDVEARDSVYGKTLYLDYPEKISDKKVLDEDGDPTGESIQDDSNKKDLLEVLKMIMPVGSIIMHNGSISKEELLSYGWAICDGTNGTPNLTGKFIKGVTSTSDVGTTGGNSTVTLTTANLPSHSHTYNVSSSSTASAGSHSHTVTSTSTTIAQGEGTTVTPIGSVGSTSTTGSHTHSITLSSTNTSSVGNGTAFNIEPPYYSLIYIMRVK